MKKLNTALGSILVFSLVMLSRVEAATVQYLIDQSNGFADSADYLLVTVSDSTPGQLDFLVETQPALSDMAGHNFGIASFGFNFETAMELSQDDFVLPEKWKVHFDRRMSEAGRFDVRLLGTGQTRQDPLQFSVVGLGLDDIIPGFASHTTGFVGSHNATGTFFYGNTAVSAVPVPAAFWLFGSGMLMLGRVATRRRI